MRYLGIDYGHRNIGLAISDEAGNFCYPHSVIKTVEAIKAISDLCKKENIGAIVIGESINLNGEPNKIFEAAKKLGDELASKIGIPVSYQNETYTSREAQRIIGDDDNVDARAAAIILGSFLSSKR